MARRAAQRTRPRHLTARDGSMVRIAAGGAALVRPSARAPLRARAPRDTTPGREKFVCMCSARRGGRRSVNTLHT